MAKTYKQGIFEPINKSKYTGARLPVFRSSWELKYMRFCDISENVLSWASESVKIPYYSPVDKKMHTYYPDFILRVKKKDGTTKTILVEIKPFRQTRPPKIAKNRNVKTMITESETYSVNQAKWAAAKHFCTEQGWEFYLLTEKDL